MNTQTHLFDGIDIEVPACHRNDPLPSIVAEERMRKSGKLIKHRTIVVLAVRDFPGSTAPELAFKTQQLDRYEFSRRLPEAEQVGLVKKGIERNCRINGTLMTTWEPV